MSMLLVRRIGAPVRVRGAEGTPLVPGHVHGWCKDHLGALTYRVVVEGRIVDVHPSRVTRRGWL